MGKYIILLFMACLVASCGDDKIGGLCSGVKCVEGEACKDGKCVKGFVDVLCEKSEVSCVDGKRRQVCEQGKEAEVVECGDGERCRDGQCVGEHLAGIGESCESKECVESAFCNDEVVCSERIKVGGVCDISEHCQNGLDCHESVCKRVVNLGEACGDIEVCAEGSCLHGFCKKIVGLYESCDGDRLCSNEAECVDGQCVLLKGDCKNQSECGGDRYCCLDESCGVRHGKCVSFSSEHPSDKSCGFKMKTGVFEAAVQCYWKSEGGVYPESKNVLSTILVGKIKNRFGIEKPLLVFVSYNPQVIRIIDSDTCKAIESIPVLMHEYSSFALADFNKDGYMEIVVMEMVPTIYQWDDEQQKHVAKYRAGSDGGILRDNASFSIHDINGDGIPEVIAPNGSVFNDQMVEISQNRVESSRYTSPAIADFNHDRVVDMFSEETLYSWDEQSKSWQRKAVVLSGDTQIQVGFADFGTRDGDDFDFESLDGVAEIVLSGALSLQIWSIFSKQGVVVSPKQVMRYDFSLEKHWGYPMAIGDFNGDGKAEIGVASKSTFGVYDPKCKVAEVGKCAKPYVVWERSIHDESGLAGASAFDFDGDGKIEIVYGDECYTRVYDGRSGEILFSNYRSSGTLIEYPTIADVDGDGSAEIVVPSDSYQCPLKEDPSHRGVMCQDDSDCYSRRCVRGLCRCNSHQECNWQQIGGKLFQQYSCMSALGGDGEGGNVCRASQGPALPGVMVLRDRMDRWVSSRHLWNQHSYSITHVNDDGSIPKLGDWLQNFRNGGANNYRQQLQGPTGAGVAPDITGRFTSAADTCKVGEGGQVVLTAQVCNRGTKDVGSKMPAVFYAEEIKVESQLCVSYTDDIVPVGVCKSVSCGITMEVAKGLVNKKIVLVVNDDGRGGRTTVECNSDNNMDDIVVSRCVVN